MMLRFAALSIAEINARIPFASAAVALVTFFAMLRRRVRTLRFRKARFVVCRARLAADLVLAMVISPDDSIR
jgi:hypothetical protein